MSKSKKKKQDNEDLVMNTPTIGDVEPRYLQLTSASNILYEDDQVFGVTLQNSILDNAKDIYQIASLDNLYDKSNGIQINMPESYSQLDGSLINGTSLGPLFSQSSGSLFVSPVENIINQNEGVLKLNEPIENSLTDLQITTGKYLHTSLFDPSLKVTTLDNINMESCGSIRLTTNDNLYIRDNVDVYNSQLLNQLNSDSLIFKAPENKYLTINVNSNINPFFEGISVNSILEDSNSLLRTFELGKIGSNLEIGIQESNSIQSRFLDLTNSYSHLYTPHHSGISILESLPESLAVNSSLEYYRNTDLVRIISTEPEQVETEDESIQQKVNDELKRYLSEIDPDLNIMLDGARDAINSNNPDKIRHVTTSLRELFTHVLHHLSPNEEIKKWSKDPKHFDKGKPTRRSRLLYICREINHDKFTDFVKTDIDSMLSFINLFQGGTHSVKSKITGKQLYTILFKTDLLPISWRL